MSTLYILAAWASSVNMLHEQTACPYYVLMRRVHTAYYYYYYAMYMFMLYIFAACLCCVQTVRVPAAFPCSLSMLHNRDICPCCITVIYVHAAFPFYMSALHIHAVYPCCMSLLTVHAAVPLLHFLAFSLCCMSTYCRCCISVSDVAYFFQFRFYRNESSSGVHTTRNEGKI